MIRCRRAGRAIALVGALALAPNADASPTVWTPNAGGALNSVWGTGQGDIWAVGTGGVILHSRDGSTWTPQSSGSSVTLERVWGTGANDVYVAGEAGTILHSSDRGATWQIQHTGTTRPLGRLWGTSTELFAQARDGDGDENDQPAARIVLHTTDHGRTWSKLTGKPPVMAGDRRIVVACGAGGDATSRVRIESVQAMSSRRLVAIATDDGAPSVDALLRSTDGGKTWRLAACRERGWFSDLWCAGPRCYVVSANFGIGVTRDGKKWRWLEEARETADDYSADEMVPDLRAVWADPGGLVIGVGNQDAIQRSTDGGKTWTTPPGEAAPHL